MKRCFTFILIFLTFLLTSCGEKVSIETIQNKIDAFKEKVNSSETYIYTNNIDVKLPSGDHMVWEHYHKLKFSVDNNKRFFKIEQNRKDITFNMSYLYAEKYGNIYDIGRQGSQKYYDYYIYEYTVERFKRGLEEDWYLNIENREKVINIDNEIIYSDGNYQIKYDFYDFKEAFNDATVIKYVEGLELPDTVFVLVNYVFSENSMSITHTFDLDGKDENVIKGPKIVLETIYEIGPIEIRDLNPDTLLVGLKDIDSDEIYDATGFDKIAVFTSSSDKGYFKIYLEKGIYNIILNDLGYDVDHSQFKYNFYNSNKEKIEESESYNLEEGWYYIYIDYRNRFPFVINKLS